MDTPETLRFLTPAQAAEVRARFGTPCYVYDAASLRRAAAECLAFPHAFGLTVRYAMKASPNAALLRFFDALGLHFDASSGGEAARALRAGITAEKISLVTQEMPADFAHLHRQGVLFDASSLHQLETFGRQFPGAALGLRFNPGLGSGSTAKTNVGGPGASFGIWHEALAEVHDIVARHRLRIARIHSHIGSGNDPAMWQCGARRTLELAREFPSAEAVNLGGGFKIARMSYEKTTDLQALGAGVKTLFEDLAREAGRKLRLEIEPGTFLVARAGALVCSVQDIVSTGAAGHTFIKLDAGMTEVLRPSLYGAQHPVVIVPASAQTQQASAGLAGNGSLSASRAPVTPPQKYLVVGHCCESGDLLTPAPGESETLGPRRLAPAAIGDLGIIEGTGAYCAAMSTVNYNSFPAAPEVLLEETGALRLIRRRQTPEQIVENEV